MHLLLLEDDEHTRALLESVFGFAGYSVTAASTAKEALVRMHDGAPPNLIIIDASSVGADELQEQLRQDHALAKIPVVSVETKRSKQSFDEPMDLAIYAEELLRALEDNDDGLKPVRFDH